MMLMRVVIAADNTSQHEPIRQTVLGMGMDCTPDDCVTPADLPVRLSHGAVNLLLVHAGDDVHSAIDTIKSALPMTPAPVLAVGPTRQPPEVLQLIQGGAREYLDEATLQPGLEKVMDKLHLTALAKLGHGQVVGVVSATPGSGVTTIASAIAFLWAAKHKDKVVLAELGREAADLALSLDLNPRHTVVDVAGEKNLDRLDATFIKRCMTPHAGGVQVLAYKPETLSGETLDPRAVRKAVLLMKSHFAGAVLDLGHLMGEEHFEAMRVCDNIVLVVRLDVPGLRQARRFLRLLTEHGLPRERIRLVANRYGQRGQIAWKKAEEALGAKFTEYIPEDSGAINYALNQGKPLAQARKRCSVVRRIGKLAAMLNGRA
jgi:pilus assembly protein CpaE